MDGDASFGHWLTLRRAALHLSRVELAHRVGCATITLRKIEADERRPSELIAARLAEQLNLAPHERLTFVKVARGELSVDRLALPNQIADRPARAASVPPRTNLPVPLTALIGRRKELAAIHTVLRRPDVRLLTLTGPGGIGKTRLALQVADDTIQDFAHGAYFVNLAPISDPALVVPTIAQALGVQESGNRSLLECLTDQLREQELLLLLDNFEQVLDAALELAKLLASCPKLKLLITSREALHLYGEHEFEAPPLELPDRTQLPPLEHLGQFEAVRLFIERAQAAKADFGLNDANAPAIVEICHWLDGLPLAIELAAARIKLFGPQALLSRLEHRLNLLTGGGRDLPARHQTIRGAIDWSYNLLSATEQALFARLGVFVGGCTLEAAEAVCNTDGAVAINVTDGVASLIDKRLLRLEEGMDGEPRVMMLETIREYALEKLAGSGKADALRQQHATYFLKFAEQYDPWPRLHAPSQQQWLDRLEAEHDNLRAASVWFAERGEAERGMQLAGALVGFWADHFHWHEGRDWLEAALARSGNISLTIRAKAVFGTAWLAVRLGDGITAHAYVEEGLALFRQLDDKPAIAIAGLLLVSMVLNKNEYAMARACAEECLALFHEVSDYWGCALARRLLGDIARLQGNFAQAVIYNEENLTFFRQIGDKRGITEFLIGKGILAELQGKLDQAVACYAESLAISRELGAKDVTAIDLYNLGGAVLQQGDDRRAAACFAEGLALSREIGYRIGIAVNLAGIAGVAGIQGHPERATQLFGAANALFDTMADMVEPEDRAIHDRNAAVVRAQLGEEAFAAAWAAGQAMPLEQAIAEALDH